MFPVMIAHANHTKNAMLAMDTNAENAIVYTFENRSLRSSFPELYLSTTRAARPNVSRRLNHSVSVATWVGDWAGDLISSGPALTRQAYRKWWPFHIEYRIGRIAILRFSTSGTFTISMGCLYCLGPAPSADSVTRTSI